MHIFVRRLSEGLHCREVYIAVSLSKEKSGLVRFSNACFLLIAFDMS